MGNTMFHLRPLRGVVHKGEGLPFGLVDHSHATFANFLENLVRTDSFGNLRVVEIQRMCGAVVDYLLPRGRNVGLG